MTAGNDRSVVPPLEDIDLGVALAPPRAHGEVIGRGVLRAVPEDFQVEELAAVMPDGTTGEHAWLWVRKRGANTEWVARALARHAGVKPMAVGFAGLKDRHAVTRQWFSVALAGGVEPDWTSLAEPGVDVLEVRRGPRKLRRGELLGNRFTLRVTGLEADPDLLDARLRRIAEIGVPNYFGAQRFGHDGGNIAQARALFERRLRTRDRHRRGLYLSAARSLLFNRVLAHRVLAGCWVAALPGEVSPPASSTRERSAVTEPSNTPQASGPLWGRGRSASTGAALAMETAALEGLDGWRHALEHAGLKQERRALCVPVGDLRWHMEPLARVLELTFTLPAGAFATVVLRELLEETPSEGSRGS